MGMCNSSCPVDSFHSDATSPPAAWLRDITGSSLLSVTIEKMILGSLLLKTLFLTHDEDVR